MLPFLNLGGDGEAGVLTDGIVEDLLTALAALGAVRVISRTSTAQFRNSPLRIRDIARELHVDLLIEGSVRREGRRVRVAVRIIDGHTDTQLCAECYEYELLDLFDIQRRIARDLSCRLASTLDLEIVTGD